MENNFTQLCVWPGVILEDENGPITPEAFEAWMKENFGARIKYENQIKTLPDMENGEAVPDTGGRNDVFFYVHQEDIPSFAIPRLQAGIRWWEDVVGNKNHLIYPKDILKKYPKTW